jgi:hypothetical protein
LQTTKRHRALSGRDRGSAADGRADRPLLTAPSKLSVTTILKTIAMHRNKRTLGGRSVSVLVDATNDCRRALT